MQWKVCVYVYMCGCVDVFINGWLCDDVDMGVEEINFLTCATAEISSHCVICVPTYIVCSFVELGGVCELRQEMGQQRHELLREIELLKMGKCM